MYKIYQQEIHEIDMYSHLHAWHWHLAMHLGQVPEGKAYVFPLLSSAGDPHIYEQMLYEKAQSLIQTFAADAGLKKKFTTHCFRWGGAQYHFMYAPLSDHHGSLVGRLGYQC